MNAIHATGVINIMCVTPKAEAATLKGKETALKGKQDIPNVTEITPAEGKKDFSRGGRPDRKNRDGRGRSDNDSKGKRYGR